MILITAFSWAFFLAAVWPDLGPRPVFSLESLETTYAAVKLHLEASSLASELHLEALSFWLVMYVISLDR